MTKKAGLSCDLNLNQENKIDKIFASSRQKDLASLRIAMLRQRVVKKKKKIDI